MSEPLTLDRVRADVAELLYLEPSDVDDSADLLGEGLDSVRILSLVERWRLTGVEITFIELAERPTVLAWWQLLSGRLSDG
ncbi:phosphopantetheine-binding protein [Actinocrispum wychmicini]|uniref:Aryl carrier-like protein n=1 Tax=Actinocrispum wychmicini TaxID=1213861 RepID=A0A4R2JTN6_9PSEU|nr:phosphopantetheine-binding protein [Actinocrispum wychmicini]TCO60648.1 aryl carrier-like protein [Actinocrispum wychmicini]